LFYTILVLDGYNLNRLNDPVTTPHTSNCMSSVISIGEYAPVEFAGINIGAPVFGCRANVLMVNSPLTTANIILPTVARLERSTTTLSPGNNPASIIESPFTVAKKVASFWSMRKSLVSSCFSTCSSAGEGKPAETLDAYKLSETGKVSRLGRSNSMTGSKLMRSFLVWCLHIE